MGLKTLGLAPSFERQKKLRKKKGHVKRAKANQSGGEKVLSYFLPSLLFLKE